MGVLSPPGSSDGAIWYRVILFLCHQVDFHGSSGRQIVEEVSVLC